MSIIYTQEDFIKLRKKALQNNKEVSASYLNEKYEKIIEDNDYYSIFALEITEDQTIFHFHFLQNERTDKHKALPFVVITAEGKFMNYCYQIKKGGAIEI